MALDHLARSLERVGTALLHPVDEPFPPGPHDRRSAVAVGRWLGIAVLTAFLTGLVSHLHQHPVAWFDLPSRPVWGYQVTQGLHVIAGTAAVPLLLAKLWVVFPRLFVWPPVRDVVHGIERALLVPLVAGTLFELVSGLTNVARWYPWPFYFPMVHYAVAWLVIGSLTAHLAFKARHWVRRAQPDDAGPLRAESDGAASEGAAPTLAGPDVDADRRALLAAALGSAAAVTLATAGQTVPLLRAISVLAPRDPLDGPQGLAVNRTADAAGVRSAALDPGWRLTVVGERSTAFSLAELMALPRQTVELPLACVEGWSYTAAWTGVPLRAVLERAGVRSDAHLRAVSLEQNWLYAASPLNPAQAWDPLTLLAFAVNGQPLTLDHGLPLRLIGPNRPGVQQTKWLTRIEPA